MSDQKKSQRKLSGEKFVEVQVVTTAALFPPDGYERVPAKQKITPLLNRAAAALGLTDTTGYIVTLNGTEVDSGQTYEALGVSGQVVLRWGPRAGAGG